MPGFTTRPEIRGTFGVVASTHWLASSVAMGVLEKGGNAFDAAVAAGFTLQVVEPHLNGPLGDAPILVYSAKNRRCDVICGQGGPPPRRRSPTSGASGSTSSPAPASSPRRSPAPSTPGCGYCAITGRWRYPS
jgi:gamma-glutamyltranspeptidase